MFLHVGADVVVNLRRVIAILDLRSAGPAAATRELLERMQGKQRVVDIAGGEPKSLVLTDAEAILSPISSTTLKRRSEAFGSPGDLEPPL